MGKNNKEGSNILCTLIAGFIAGFYMGYYIKNSIDRIEYKNLLSDEMKKQQKKLNKLRKELKRLHKDLEEEYENPDYDENDDLEIEDADIASEFDDTFENLFGDK